MKTLRRVMGVTKRDKVRSEAILRELKASKLSVLIEERQLRYGGHKERYPEDRWVKFVTRAALPGQKKTGQQKQYCKTISKLLQKHGLTTDMMVDKKGWRTRLTEIFPKSNEEKPQPSPIGTEEAEN